jgi:hypothetical protein
MDEFLIFVLFRLPAFAAMAAFAAILVLCIIALLLPARWRPQLEKLGFGLYLYLVLIPGLVLGLLLVGFLLYMILMWPWPILFIFVVLGVDRLFNWLKYEWHQRGIDCQGASPRRLCPMQDWCSIPHQ